MPDNEVNDSDITNELATLRGRTNDLEQQLVDARQQSNSTLVRSEIKVEAIRAGIVDLDGLRLLDTSSVTIKDDGEVVGAIELIQRFRAAKPWLFGGSSSSRAVQAPQPQPPRTKLAVDMTDIEYAAARAAIIRQII